MKLRHCAVIACAFYMAACASTQTGTFAPHAQAEQQSRYTEGTPVITSRGQNTLVMFGPATASSDLSQDLEFLILIANNSVNAFDVGPEKVIGATDGGIALHIYTSVELEKQAHDAANKVRFAAAMGALSNGLAAANAGYSNSYGNISGSTPYSSYSASYAGTTYSQSAASAAQLQANAANAQLASNANAQISNIMAHSQSGAFQRQTISPGADYFSPVRIGRVPKGTKGIVVKVVVGGDTHTFYWTYTLQ